MSAEFETTVTIQNEYGLHARPAMMLVKLANKFAASITITKHGPKRTHTVNAKSMMEVMTLAAEKDTDLVVRAEGDDAEGAVQAIQDLVNSKFDEMESAENDPDDREPE